MERIKYPFVLKLLEDKLRLEMSSAVLWKKVLDSPSYDALAKRQAHGNLSPTENRITELKTVIQLITTNEETQTKTKS